MLTYLKSRFSNKKGQGMVEYGLIIAVIAVVVLIALTPLGTAIASVFTRVSASLTTPGS